MFIASSAIPSSSVAALLPFRFREYIINARPENTFMINTNQAKYKLYPYLRKKSMITTVPK